MEGLDRILAVFFSTSMFSALLGLGLALASRKFRVEKDKTVEAITTVLPGLNCGVCGYSGCEAYAEALSSEADTDTGKCSPGGPDTLAGLSEILGRETEESGGRMVARLACLGGDDVAVRDFVYRGYADCEAVRMHFHGDKGCKYGCLGLGSCVKSCPVDAIDYTPNGIVAVDEKRCIGCEICVTVCPTGVMRMIPEDADWFVACSSRDRAKDTKAVCSVGCIGCRICERQFPDAGYIVADNLSRLEYTQRAGEGRDAAAAACPPRCIIKIKDE